MERRSSTWVSIIVSDVDINGNFDKKNLGGELRDKMGAANFGVGKASKQREQHGQRPQLGKAYLSNELKENTESTVFVMKLER